MIWGSAAAVLVGAVLFVAWGMPNGRGLGFAGYKLDLNVYRLGSRAWLDGHQIYGRLPLTRRQSEMPFTYPPISAVALAPLAMLPFGTSAVVLNVLSVVLLGATIVLALRGAPLAALALAGVVALAIEPTRATFAFGQVNIVLMAMVAADVLLDRPPWRRGVLVGLAAGLKLTPAVFIVYFLLRRDRRRRGDDGGDSGGLVVVGFALAPHDSARYWGGVAFEAKRVGAVEYAGNQSVRAMVVRAGLTDPVATLVWLAAAALVLALTVFAMRRCLAAGEPVLALGCNAIGGLLVSPISWTHHWVWLVPMLAAMFNCAIRRRDGRLFMTALVGTVLALTAPQWHFPYRYHREFEWSVWQQIAGSPYVLFGVVALVMVGVALGRSSLSLRPAASVGS